jgi:hypothetical protein
MPPVVSPACSVLGRGTLGSKSALWQRCGARQFGPCPRGAGPLTTRRRFATLVRILIADPHDVVRTGARKIVETQSNWEVVAVAVVDVEGTILSEAASALVVGPAVVFAPDQEPAATLSSENKPLVYRPASNSQPTPLLADFSEAREERLLAVGERHLAQGNIAAARAFFRRAADAGLAVGATLLATTYDPIELQRLKVLGVVADPTEARKWYRRARKLGAPDDPSRFIGCKC